MKFLAFFTIIAFSFMSAQAKADFPEFEPSMLCLAAGGASYSVAPTGDEMLYAGVSCAVGYWVGSMINDHYREKYTDRSDEEISKLNKMIDEIQKAQAEAKNPVEAGGFYRIKTKVVPGGKLPNGAVRKSTLEVSVENPASMEDVSTRIGK